MQRAHASECSPRAVMYTSRPPSSFAQAQIPLLWSMRVPRLWHAHTAWARFSSPRTKCRSTAGCQSWTISSKARPLHHPKDRPSNTCPGILFPPDENGLLKLCSCRFITNYYNSHTPGASLGHSHQDFPEDGIPRQIEEEMREFVRDLIPELADRPWAMTRMCWDGDTHDVNFRICPSPTNANLFIATAGSGHGFKFLPTIGAYVVDMLQGKLAPEYGELWRWRFGAVPVKTGEEPHPWPVRDLGELDGWKGRNKRFLVDAVGNR